MFIVYLQDYSLSISYFNFKIKKALLFDFFFKVDVDSQQMPSNDNISYLRSYP
jgi:hypothetical protein